MLIILFIAIIYYVNYLYIESIVNSIYIKDVII